MSLDTAPEDCLPAALRSPATVSTRIAAGMSGAAVYRVDTAGRAHVLKIAAPAETDADWRRALGLQRLAADAGLSPKIVHVDERHRAVVTDWVEDRSFPAWYRSPATHEAALTALGRIVRRIHTLPLPAGLPARDPREVLAQLWEGLKRDFALPRFVHDAIERVRSETAVPSDRAPVLGHNDLNPTSLLYDGERLLLLDWAAAGPIDPYFDLATLAVFLRMDDAACLQLLCAYDGAAPVALPARFVAMRRWVAALAGTMQLFLARQLKHPGSATDTAEAALPLGEFYRRLGAGEVTLGTPDGHWAFGLSLLQEDLAGRR